MHIVYFVSKNTDFEFFWNPPKIFSKDSEQGVQSLPPPAPRWTENFISWQEGYPPPQLAQGFRDWGFWSLLIAVWQYSTGVSFYHTQSTNIKHKGHFTHKYNRKYTNQTLEITTTGTTSVQAHIGHNWPLPAIEAHAQAHHACLLSPKFKQAEAKIQTSAKRKYNRLPNKNTISCQWLLIKYKIAKKKKRAMIDK